MWLSGVMNNIKSRRIHPYTGVKSAGFFVFSEVVKYTIRGRFVYTPKNKNKVSKVSPLVPVSGAARSILISPFPPWISHGSCRHYTGSCTVGCKMQH